MGGQISRSFVLMEPVLREELAAVPTLRMIAPAAHIGEAAFYGLLAGLDCLAGVKPDVGICTVGCGA